MSLLYIFRHGQAGTRDDYDRLSDTGKEQARRLGLLLASEAPRFDLFLSGPLRRQRETAEIVREQMGGPALEVDERWAEFDLDAVAKEIAPQLAADDPEFARAHENLLATVAAGDSGIHRQWTHADTQVVRAWVEGRYPLQTESWVQFCERVALTRERLSDLGEDAPIAVSTSATPMAIWIGLALELQAEAVLRLAGHTFNGAYSILRLRGFEVELLAYNAAAHLPPELRTLR